MFRVGYCGGCSGRWVVLSVGCLLSVCGVVVSGFGVCDLLNFPFLCFSSLVFVRLVRFPLHYMVYCRVLGPSYCGGPLCTL